jgi:hypothetical protein
MKIRFLCLLGLVTVMVSSYAPFARADEALQFDKSAVAAPNVWMATDPIIPREACCYADTARVAPAETPDAAPQGTPERTFVQTVVETAIETAVGAHEDAVIPVTVVPAILEPPVASTNKADVAARKEAPLSFDEPAIAVKKEPVAESPAPTSDKPAQAEPAAPAEPSQAGTIRPAEPSTPSQSPRKPSASRKPVELGFTLAPNEPLYEPERAMPHAPATAKTDDAVASGMMGGLFTGDVNSLVAKAVGSAEGTRTPTGDRTRAYYGHTDPGNRVWNRGSFSYQHSAKSPEDADQKQLQRLANQAMIIEARAADYGLHLTLEEKLNGIDLANQAPKAALDRGGYIDWLAKARQRGMKGADAVLWARTRSFINPVTQRWDAPGLGNTAERIERDQARRMDAIAQAIAANQDAVDRAVKVASAPAATGGKAAKPAKAEQSSQQAAEGQGIANLLAEKLVEMFGGDRVPDASTPVANESAGIQQLFAL